MVVDTQTEGEADLSQFMKFWHLMHKPKGTLCMFLHSYPVVWEGYIHLHPCFLSVSCKVFGETTSFWGYFARVYCKFGNFQENFIFANSVKRHICEVKISWLRHDLPISVNDSDLFILRGFSFHETSHMHSFAKIKPSRKIPNLQ